MPTNSRLNGISSKPAFSANTLLNFSLILAIAWAYVSISAFTLINSADQIEKTKTIKAQLNAIEGLTNFEDVGARISDLTQMGLIHCPKVKLKTRGPTLVILNQQFTEACKNLHPLTAFHYYLGFHRQSTFNVTSINGMTYNFDMHYRANTSYLLSFWMVLFSGLLLILSLGFHYKNRQELQHKLILVREEEAQKRLETAKQVAHDIRSPLTALQVVAKRNKINDPGLSAVFEKATKRISQIADDLLSKERGTAWDPGRKNSNELQFKLQTTHPALKPKLRPKLSLVKDTQVTNKGTATAKANEDIETNISGIFDERDLDIFEPEEETTSQTPVVAPFPVLSSVLEEKRIALENQKASFSMYCPDELKSLLCNGKASELARITSNLINNSYDALEDKGNISVSMDVEEDRDELIVEIRDTGKGIASHQIDEVLAGKSLKKNGNGLGLSHAKKTIESWGGEFNIVSKPKQGTKIEMRLPLA